LNAANQIFSFKVFILLPLLLPLGTKIRENLKSRNLKSGFYCVYICQGFEILKFLKGTEAKHNVWKIKNMHQDRTLGRLK